MLSIPQKVIRTADLVIKATGEIGGFESQQQTNLLHTFDYRNIRMCTSDNTPAKELKVIGKCDQKYLPYLCHTMC